MKIFLALVWREIYERRLLLLASAFLGLVPVVLPLLPWIPQRSTPEELRAATLMVLAVLLGGATLLILGATIVGRDLSEGRLGFYFSRPVSGWALWGSRITAAGVLLLASLALLAIPSAVLDFGSWTPDLSSGSSRQAWPLLALDEVFFAGVNIEGLPQSPPVVVRLAYGLGVILMLLALTHVASTIVRARSPWLLADLGGLAAVVAVGWAARDALVREQALGALVWAQWLLLPWILAALWLAGGLQLIRGRTDLRRGHCVLSLTLWPLLIAGVLAFGAFARWVAGSSLDDLETSKFLAASPSEEWLLAGGPVRRRAGTETAFLVEVNSGDAWRLGSLAVTRVWHEFSEDDGTFVWARCESFQPLDCRLWAKDLHDRENPPRDTEIPIVKRNVRLALSEDGSRLAITEGRRIGIYDLPLGDGMQGSARLLMAAQAESVENVYFVSRDLVRLYESVELEEGFRTRVRQIDLIERASASTGMLPRGLAIRRSPERDAVLFKSSFPPGFGLYDGATGEKLFELDERWRQIPARGRFLADGRVVMSLHETGKITLLVTSPEGEEQHRIERVATGGHLGGELATGRMLVALRERTADSGPLGEWTTYELDAATGELTHRIAGVMPLGSGSRLLWTLDGEVTELRPESGERRIVLPVGRRQSK